MPVRQALYGSALLTNSRPVKTTGLYGRVRFSVPSLKGMAVYGAVYTMPFADGFHGNTLTVAELVEITCLDGSVARLTPHGESIVYNGHTWQAVPMRRGRIRMHSDLQVDKVDIELGLIGITVGARQYTIPDLVKRGFLRQARVRIVAIDYMNPTWEKFRFDGFVSDSIGYNAGVLSLKVGSALDRLNDKFPKLIYSEFCPHRLFNSYCGLDANAYKVSGSVGAGSARGRIYASAFLYSAHAAGYWVRGEIKITDADSLELNVSRTILTHGDGYVDLLLPFESAPLAGQTFDVWPGCDKSGQTCHEKFDNYANFLGFEYIPKPEVLFG